MSGAPTFGTVLREVHACWDRAVERATPTVRHVQVAGVDIELAVTGEALAAAFLPAFECHDAATAQPTVLVGAWDAAATGVPVVSRPPELNPQIRHWMAAHDGEPTAELAWDDSGAVRMADTVSRRHLLGVHSVASLSPWEVGAPLRRQLRWALGPDALFLHAAAVTDGDGAALLMGPSGSAKSTTSLACVAAGMGFLADDYCVVRDGEPPSVHLLHALARVDPDELSGREHLGPPVPWSPTVDEAGAGVKALLALSRSVPEQVIRSAPVRTVIVPARTGRTTPRLVPARPADVLRQIGPGALWQLHVDAQRELAALRRLLTAVPVYRLELSARRDANPAAVREAIRS